MRSLSRKAVPPAPQAPGRTVRPVSLLPLLLVLVLVSCARPTSPIDPSFDLAAYRPFLTPAPLLPFRATGSARIQYGGEAEAGQFILTAHRNLAFRFQLLAPITGALVVELRFDEQRLLALNYGEGTYFLAENTEENRRRLFSLDITPAEFLMMLTGRVPRAAFEAGGGAKEGPRQRVMESAGVRYRFLLGEDGLPKGWSKARRAGGGAGTFYLVEYRVEYREFLTLPPASGKENGAPFRIPRKIRVRSGDGDALLVIGLREFLPGAGSPRPLSFDLPKGKSWRFEPPPPPASP